MCNDNKIEPNLVEMLGSTLARYASGPYDRPQLSGLVSSQQASLMTRHIRFHGVWDTNSSGDYGWNSGLSLCWSHLAAPHKHPGPQHRLRADHMDPAGFEWSS